MAPASRSRMGQAHGAVRGKGMGDEVLADLEGAPHRRLAHLQGEITASNV